MQAGGGLFDLHNDPGETRDVTADHRAVAAELGSALDEWIRETKPRSTRDAETRPITLGHPDAEYTQMPARDAVPHGGITRSNRFPNCTFMTQWTSPDDKITWNVDVLSEGDFEVEMYYACAADSVGSELALSAGRERISAVIDVANDVPLSGMEHDRFERAEGYVKAWRAMSLGRIHLRPGPTTLTLAATRVTGKQVADMRLLMFRRIETTP
jgi:hypothetical protein